MTVVITDCTTPSPSILACMHRYGGVPGISSVIRFFGNVFAWVSLLAGAFDGLENLALIQFLLGSELTVWNGMSRWSILAKFGLLLSVMG